MDVQMHLSDPAQNKLLGIGGERKKENPFFTATTLEQNGNYPGAETIFLELLNNDFNNCCVLASFGMNQVIQGRHGLGHTLLARALDNFGNFEKDLAAVGIDLKKQPPSKDGDTFMTVKRSEIMNAIGTAWKGENLTEKARYWFEKSQAQLKAPSSDVQNNLATLYINEGHPEKALPFLRTALEQNTDHSQARWNLSLCQLELGQYREGFQNYIAGKRAKVRCERNYSTSGQTPEWDGTKGQTVVVYGEQGIGDEIMFASCIADLARDCKLVIFETHKRLHSLFFNSLKNVICYGTREDERVYWPMTDAGAPRYQIDAKVAAGDLPRFYRNELSDFPGTRYVTPSMKIATRWANKFNEVFTDDKPVIGLNWIGGHKKTRVEVRSLTLEQMLPVLKQDAHFVSLQYTPCEDEIFEFEQKHGIKIHHWPEGCQNENYEETAGMVASLDLVITNCSSIVHLAGAMGTPAWVMVPSRPAWRYRLDLDYMPWYGKTVMLFRQAPDTVAWEPVVEAVANKLLSITGKVENEIHDKLCGIAEAVACGG